MLSQERALAGLDKQEFLELILHDMSEGVVVANTRGEFLLWNAEAERIVGRGMERVPIESWSGEYGVFTPDTKEPFPSDELPLARALRGEPCDQVELFLRNPGIPQGVHVRVSARPLKDLSGRLLGGVSVFHDVTAERAAREALRSHAAVVNASPDAILGLTPQGRVAQANPAAAHLWGSELKGREAASLVGEELRERFRETLARGAAGACCAGTGFVFERADGTRFHGSMSLAPIEEPQGRVLGLSMIVRDDTAKDELLAFASHELRAPAAALLMSLEYLKETLDRPENARRVLELASRNCERLVLLAARCLEGEALRSGGVPLNKSPLDAAELVREAVELNRPCAERFGVGLVGQGLEGEARVLADREALLQAVTNLVTNAAKFSPRGEAVRLALERRREAVRIMVADRGPGIPEEVRGRLFQRFVRASSAQKAGIEGAGLGLSIAKEIVERLGGSIGYETEAGRGTVFFIGLQEASA